jgi:hypothetical protein
MTTDPESISLQNLDQLPPTDAFIFWLTLRKSWLRKCFADAGNGVELRSLFSG